MARSPIRKFHTGRALESVSALVGILHELTEEEVHHCLRIEAGAQRRKAVIQMLVRRAVRFNRQRFLKQLMEKYDVPHILEDPEQC